MKRKREEKGADDSLKFNFFLLSFFKYSIVRLRTNAIYRKYSSFGSLIVTRWKCKIKTNISPRVKWTFLIHLFDSRWKFDEFSADSSFTGVSGRKIKIDILIKHFLLDANSCFFFSSKIICLIFLFNQIIRWLIIEWLNFNCVCVSIHTCNLLI